MENNVERQKRLISAIEQVTPLSPQIREAFLAIDRGLFVPMYYDREGSVLEWTMVTTGDAAYTDEALVTKVDSRSRHPISSSSQPSLMAVQLEALDVQPGQRILEIGTGTGYNAALLAHIVGPAGHVVSVDVDRDLVQLATQHLAAAGYERVQVVCDDGLRGYVLEAPYDRIIATGGFRSVPTSWLDQLAIQGKLIGNLIGNLASAFVCLTKEQHRGHGTFLPIGGDKRYMELHHGEFLRPSLPVWSFYEKAPLEEYLISFDFPSVSDNTDFLFLLQCLFPRVERYWRYDQEQKLLRMYFVTERSCVHVQPRSSHEWIVQERGDGGLWDCLAQAYSLWEQYRHPSLARYHMDVDATGQYISLGEMHWRLD